MPRFGEDDFHLGSLLGDVSGASFADWPVDYAMLEPFYGYVERILGVQGMAGAHPFETAAERAVPDAARRPHVPRREGLGRRPEARLSPAPLSHGGQLPAL